MELTQYFLCLASRCEQSKQLYEDERGDLDNLPRKRKKKRKSDSCTYLNEIEALEGAISTVKMPNKLKGLSSIALVVFSFIIRHRLQNDYPIEGNEITSWLVCEPEYTIEYLNALGELHEQGWVRIIENPGQGLTDQPPFSWLNALIELGDTYYREQGDNRFGSLVFTSNDNYLDAVFTYLKNLISNSQLRINNPEIDLATYQPFGWYRKIVMRTAVSTSPIPAAQVQSHYSLSACQHIVLLGLLGMRDIDLDYSFNNPTEAAKLFSTGRVCRELMRDHLFGRNSPLMRHKLIEGTQGSFGESIQITKTGTQALLGKQSGSNLKDIKSRVMKSTLFDIETPGIRKDALQLPYTVMESIAAIIQSESKQGHKIRKKWHASLPSSWGSPIGSTILLYGPPGTGKTLTAQYLASQMKLPLIKIDASRILSCWVGESEQNIRRIFDDYSGIQREFGASPVLLINEADQLLGVRSHGSAFVDRMHNTMQNLLLEGMERFSGIMVATTNRKELLDEAFSRRFTYKLELPTPDRNLRVELWKSHLPKGQLEDHEIEQLAELNLSGGEIRIIIERAVRIVSYRGISKLEIATLMEIAREEIQSRMKRSGGINRIGF